MKKSILTKPAFRYVFEVFVIIFSVTISFYIQDILNEKDREKLKNDTLKGILIDMETDIYQYNLALDILKYRLIQADSLILGYYDDNRINQVRNYWGFQGQKISMNSLVNNAELLKKSKITKVKKIIARDTASSIKSGFYFGYLHSINGILNQIIKENKFKPKIILTGGLGYIFKDNVNFNPIYNEYLTLEGIREIGRHIQDEQWSRIK